MGQFGDLPSPPAPISERLKDFHFPDLDKSAEQRRWNELFEQVEARKHDPDKRYNSHGWVFDDNEDNGKDPFRHALVQADLLSQQLNTQEDLQSVFKKIQEDPEHSRWYWFMLARSISIPKSDIRTRRFNEIASHVKETIMNSAETPEKQKAIFRAGKFLTTFAAKWGAETFLYGLAQTSFSKEQIEDPNNETLAFLEREVHPRLYTSLQWFRAARTVWHEHLSSFGDKKEISEKRQYFDSLFTRKFAPSEKRFTMHEQSIYEKIQTFDNYSRGDAMVETDIRVVEALGLPKDTHVVDMASGSGRHILALLKKRWTSLVARDASEQFIDALKKKIDRLKTDSRITAVVRDWFNPTREGGKKAGLVLLLGRDMPHMVNSYERKKFFKTARAIMDDGAHLVFDIPDISMGEYKEMVQESTPLFDNWNIDEEGAHLVQDTMDHMLYTFRVFPELDQVIKEAQESGFEVTDAQFRWIPEAKGKPKARNLYVVCKAKLSKASKSSGGIEI